MLGEGADGILPAPLTPAATRLSQGTKPRQPRAAGTVVPPSDRPESFYVAALFLIVLLDVNTDKDAIAVQLVVDPAHVLAARYAGRKLRNFPPAAHAFEVLPNDMSHVDLNK